MTAHPNLFGELSRGVPTAQAWSLKFLLHVNSREGRRATEMRGADLGHLPLSPQLPRRRGPAAGEGAGGGGGTSARREARAEGKAQHPLASPGDSPRRGAGRHQPPPLSQLRGPGERPAPSRRAAPHGAAGTPAPSPQSCGLIPAPAAAPLTSLGARAGAAAGASGALA